MVGTVGRGGLFNETLMIRESLFVGIELSFGVERGRFSALQTRLPTTLQFVALG